MIIIRTIIKTITIKKNISEDTNPRQYSAATAASDPPFQFVSRRRNQRFSAADARPLASGRCRTGMKDNNNYDNNSKNESNTYNNYTDNKSDNEDNLECNLFYS